jgi:hypothetical protein
MILRSCFFFDLSLYQNSPLHNDFHCKIVAEFLLKSALSIIAHNLRRVKYSSEWDNHLNEAKFMKDWNDILNY